MTNNIIKVTDNGWKGLAKITVKLQSSTYKGITYYQVTQDSIGNYDVFTYKTLKGATNKFNKLASYLTVKG